MALAATTSSALAAQNAARVAKRNQAVTSKQVLALERQVLAVNTEGFRQSVLKMGGFVEQIHRLVGEFWSFWLSSRCQEQTGLSPTCAKEYERLYSRSRQVDGSPVAEYVFQHADTSRPSNVDNLNRVLAMKPIQAQIKTVGTNPSQVAALAAQVIAKANAEREAPPTQAEKMDAAFSRIATLFAGITPPKDATPAQRSESQKLLRAFANRINGLGETLHLSEVGYTLTCRPT